jgi:very-short-patch-repair endonuclease
LKLPVPDDLVDLYVRTGWSEKRLSEFYDVSRTTVKRWLVEAGVKRRGIKAASNLHLSTLTPEQRAAKVAAAHDAVRGSRRPDEHVERVARARELVGYGGRTSPGTERLCAELARRGIEHRRETAVGRYNVDVTLRACPVAVEVLGGNWHGAKPIHAVRTPSILNRGWHLVFVWDTRRQPLGVAAVDQVVALAEKASVDPAAVREYWVVRGDGKLVASGRADDDEFPLVPPPVGRLD